MGIARALRRVKREAKQGGLDALRSGLGEELRSRSIPGPLRGAARRIAALIDPASVGRSSAHKPGSSATVSTVASTERSYIENLRPVPPAHANKVGSDRGDSPAIEPQVPAEDTAVDPRAVGATPVVNATPTEVAPIDATPREVAPVDATPLTLDASTLAVDANALAEAAPVAAAAADDATVANASASSDAASASAFASEVPASAADAEPAQDALASASATAFASEPSDDNTVSAAPPKPAAPNNGKAKKNGNGAPTDQKEKLAPSEEAAKSLARSGPSAPKRPNQGGKSSKKKKK